MKVTLIVTGVGEGLYLGDNLVYKAIDIYASDILEFITGHTILSDEVVDALSYKGELPETLEEFYKLQEEE